MTISLNLLIKKKNMKKIKEREINPGNTEESEAQSDQERKIK